MIRRLQIRLTAISMASLFVVLIIILGAANFFNFRRVARDADATLTFLSEHGGSFPMSGYWIKDWPGPRPMSPELPYETRYFSVTLDAGGDIEEVNTQRIAAIDDETAVSYARQILRQGDERGFIDDYRFLLCSEEGSVGQIIFLDCGRLLANSWDFFKTSFLVALVGLVAVFLLVVLLSKRLVRPIADSYDRQKQFITDAGHEIKTPITIIDADAQLLEFEMGQNEWLQDIQTQVKRLSSLTSDLIYLARIEELQDQLPMIEFPFSDLTLELAQSFQGLATAQNKRFSMDIQPMLTMCGDEKSLRQLVSILLDNALKYTEEGGSISISLQQKDRHLCLNVCNTTHIDPQELEHIFDRFYRPDRSRSSQTGGFGIGLSIAHAVVTGHHGKITATIPSDGMLCFTVLLPL